MSPSSSCMATDNRRRRFSIASVLITSALLFLTNGAKAAEPLAQGSNFREQNVEFRNGEINLSGSLLLPKSEFPVAAIVFVHGAGRHTREGLREIGEHFAANGIAALIYDKRGVGSSGGDYESLAPYESSLGQKDLSVVSVC